jgi:hypothetical protein
MGSTTHQETTRTFTATAVAIVAYRLVALQSSGLVQVTGDNSTDVVAGVTVDSCAASGNVAVKLRSSGGTAEIMTNGDAIAVADLVYSDATGKIGTDSTNVLVGYALQASSADGDVIEILLT